MRTFYKAFRHLSNWTRVVYQGQLPPLLHRERGKQWSDPKKLSGNLLTKRKGSVIFVREGTVYDRKGNTRSIGDSRHEETGQRLNRKDLRLLYYQRKSVMGNEKAVKKRSSKDRLVTVE